MTVGSWGKKERSWDQKDIRTLAFIVWWCRIYPLIYVETIYYHFTFFCLEKDSLSKLNLKYSIQRFWIRAIPSGRRLHWENNRGPSAQCGSIWSSEGNNFRTSGDGGPAYGFQRLNRVGDGLRHVGFQDWFQYEKEWSCEWSERRNWVPCSQFNRFL